MRAVGPLDPPVNKLQIPICYDSGVGNDIRSGYSLQQWIGEHLLLFPARQVLSDRFILLAPRILAVQFDLNFANNWCFDLSALHFWLCTCNNWQDPQNNNGKVAMAKENSMRLVAPHCTKCWPKNCLTQDCCEAGLASTVYAIMAVCGVFRFPVHVALIKNNWLLVRYSAIPETKLH